MAKREQVVAEGLKEQQPAQEAEKETPTKRSYNTTNKPNAKQFKYLINFQKLCPTRTVSRKELFCIFTIKGG
ncbi:hypothetical protein RJP21_20160 [Paenibacillus sp. VCA1]|uniref:hypothetical protein n=1 Tax=Paenibacillus sp. VCA1 TaxID=3039148 RepID=UPI00287157D4|nr:hypothetical protein [Paenibacillus sp. VCA1]MDR9855922.1 hypothetical protein [Paenibacillus sp. VCA1]